MNFCINFSNFSLSFSFHRKIRKEFVEAEAELSGKIKKYRS